MGEGENLIKRTEKGEIDDKNKEEEQIMEDKISNEEKEEKLSDFDIKEIKKIILEKIGELKNNTGLDLSERAGKQEEKNDKLKNKIKKLMKEIGELEEKKKALMKENKGLIDDPLSLQRLRLPKNRTYDLMQIIQRSDSMRNISNPDYVMLVILLDNFYQTGDILEFLKRLFNVFDDAFKAQENSKLEDEEAEIEELKEKNKDLKETIEKQEEKNKCLEETIEKQEEENDDEQGRLKEKIEKLRKENKELEKVLKLIGSKLETTA